jgi:hypothetical protein
VAKKAGLRGRHASPKAPKPLRLVKEFVFLHHALCVTLSEERLTDPCPAGQHRGAPRTLVAWGAPSRAEALAGAEGREGAKDQVQASINREPIARVSP